LSTISVVNILAALGVFWDISNTIMGILILAPANSIGDFVADTSLARNNKVITAFGAIYAGPLLNLLIGVGLSCTIANFSNGAPVPLARTAIEFACAATVEYALFVAIFILVFSKFEFKKWVGIFFVVSYIICLAIILLAGMDVLGTMPQ